MAKPGRYVELSTTNNCLRTSELRLIRFYVATRLARCTLKLNAVSTAQPTYVIVFFFLENVKCFKEARGIGKMSMSLEGSLMVTARTHFHDLKTEELTDDP